MADKTTKSYSLRPLEKADLVFVARWFQDAGDLAVFDRSSRVPYDLATCERLWDMSGNTGDAAEKCWFAIASDAEEVIGIVGLERISYINRDAVVALYVDQAVRREGIGMRAATMMLDFAFRQLGLNRVTSFYRADNQGSRDLTAQAGFEIEGTMRQAWFAEGAYHDMIVVGILASEWMARRDALANTLGSETVIAFGDATTSRWAWPPREPKPS